MVKMRSALKLIAVSLLLTGCTTEQVSVEPAVEEQQPPIVVEPITFSELQETQSEILGCEDGFSVSEGNHETFVCESGVIRFWEEGLTTEALAPWSIWCQPALAAGEEAEFSVFSGENFIIENHSGQPLENSSEFENLCLQLADQPLPAVELESDSSYGLLTGLSESGLCFGPPEIAGQDPLLHVCEGFGLQGSEFELWLETGEIEQKRLNYAEECGAGIVATFGENWLISTFDTEVIVSGEKLSDFLPLVSPFPFSSLCELEETG